MEKHNKIQQIKSTERRIKSKLQEILNFSKRKEVGFIRSQRIENDRKKKEYTNSLLEENQRKKQSIKSQDILRTIKIRNLHQDKMERIKKDKQKRIVSEENKKKECDTEVTVLEHLEYSMIRQLERSHSIQENALNQLKSAMDNPTNYTVNSSAKKGERKGRVPIDLGALSIEGILKPNGRSAMNGISHRIMEGMAKKEELKLTQILNDSHVEEHPPLSKTMNYVTIQLGDDVKITNNRSGKKYEIGKSFHQNRHLVSNYKQNDSEYNEGPTVKNEVKQVRKMKKNINLNANNNNNNIIRGSELDDDEVDEINMILTKRFQKDCEKKKKQKEKEKQKCEMQLSYFESNDYSFNSANYGKSQRSESEKPIIKS
jgi:hypothetical protein